MMVDEAVLSSLCFLILSDPKRRKVKPQTYNKIIAVSSVVASSLILGYDSSDGFGCSEAAEGPVLKLSDLS